MRLSKIFYLLLILPAISLANFNETLPGMPKSFTIAPSPFERVHITIDPLDVNTEATLTRCEGGLLSYTINSPTFKIMVGNEEFQPGDLTLGIQAENCVGPFPPNAINYYMLSVTHPDGRHPFVISINVFGPAAFEAVVENPPTSELIFRHVGNNLTFY